MARMYRVSVWAKMTYLVIAAGPEEAKEKVLDPVERIGVVGEPQLNTDQSKMLVAHVGLEHLEVAKPTNTKPFCFVENA